MNPYVVWRRSRGDETFDVLCVERAANPWWAVSQLIDKARLDAGDAAFVMGQLSRDEPFGGVLYDITPTSIAPRQSL